MAWNPRTSKGFRLFLIGLVLLPACFAVVYWEHIPIGFVQDYPAIAYVLTLLYVAVLSRAVGKWSNAEDAHPATNTDSPRRPRTRYSAAVFAALLLIIFLTGLAFSDEYVIGKVDVIQIICAAGAASVIAGFIAARRAGF
ncbi:hypothetical protein ABWH91_06745 [Phycisphaerales bacterium ac7]